MSLGLSPSGGGGGSSLSCSPTGIPANATGVVTQLSSGLSGTLTYSKVTGSAAALSVATGGAVSISSGLAAAATATLIARVQNATGDAIEKSFTLTGTVIAISGTPSAATIGSAYSFTPTTTGGSGTKTFSYTGTTLATYGLAFSTTTGAITGTVSGSAGTVTGTIGVSDTTGTASPSLAISIAVAGGVLSISGSPGTPAVGDTTVFTPTITGGSGSYTSLTVVSGTLPAGRSISGLTVTGTYTTAGAFSYTLRVTDSLGATADLPVSGTVSSSLPALSSTAAIYSDDFTGVADNTNLYQVPGWGGFTYLGSPNVARLPLFKVIGNVAYQPSVADFVSPSGNYLIGRDVGAATGHSISFDYISGSFPGVMLLATDQGTGALVTWGLGGKSIQISRVVAGTPTTAFSATIQAAAFPANTRIEVRAVLNGAGTDTEVRVLINGRPLLNGTTPLVVNLGAAFTGTKMGFINYNNDLKFDNVSWRLLPGAFVVTDDTAPSYASDVTSGGAFTGRDIPASGTYSSWGVTPVGIAFRTKDLTTGAVITGPTRLTGVTISGGAWSGTYRLPATNPVAVEFGPVASDGSVSFWTPMPTTKAVGALIAIYGQSEAKDLMLPVNQSLNSPVTSKVFFYDHQFFTAGGTGMNAVDAANSGSGKDFYDWEPLAVALGIPVILAGGGVSAVAIDQLIPTSGATYADPRQGGALITPYQALIECITSAGGAGRVAYFVFDQGFGDGVVKTGGASWQASLISIIAAMRTDLAAGRTAPVFINPEGRLPNTTTTANNEAGMTELRQSQQALINNGTTLYGAHASGITINSDSWAAGGTDDHVCTKGLLSPTGGNTTANQNGMRNKIRRLAMSVRAAMGLGGPSGAGPVPLSLTRAGAVVRLTVSKNGADTVTMPTTVDSIELSTSSAFGSLLTINSTASGVDGSSNPYVEWTLSADPGVPVYARTYAKRNPADLNRIEGTYTADGVTIAMQPILLPMVTPT